MPQPLPQPLTSGERRARQAAALLELGFECVPGPLTTGDVRDGDLWRITQALPAMGTRVAISVAHASRDCAEQALGSAWEAMHPAVRELSRHDPASPLSTLNESGRIDSAPAELLATLAAARRLHLRSGGIFDVTVLPLVEALRSGAGLAAAAELLPLVGDAGVHVGGRDLRLTRPGMAVTLDGIAKGRVVDVVAAALQGAGVRDYLVDAGGDIRAAGAPARGRAWSVGVRDPRGEGLLAGTLSVRDGAVATSGSYEIWFDEQRTCHHVVSPCDGSSPTELVSVTVLAPTAMLADGLATTAFLLGPAAGVAFVDSFAGSACLMVTRDGEQLRSRGWSHALSATPQGEDRA